MESEKDWDADHFRLEIFVHCLFNHGSVLIHERERASLGMCVCVCVLRGVVWYFKQTVLQLPAAVPDFNNPFQKYLVYNNANSQTMK